MTAAQMMTAMRLLREVDGERLAPAGGVLQDDREAVAATAEATVTPLTSARSAKKE
jgi:hypothetical protein